MGQSPPGSSYNSAATGMTFFQGITEFGTRFPRIRLYTSEPKKIAEQFDILVSVRAPVGEINVAPFRLCIGRGLAAIRSEYRSYSLYKIMSLRERISKFDSEGTVFGAITKDSLEKLQVILPDSAVKKTANEILQPLDNRIFHNHQEIISLTSLRDVLLPKLMSGQLRVKVT
jgi:type I restriction enzyme S subunit